MARLLGAVTTRVAFWTAKVGLGDLKRNGNRNGEALIKHMETDALVLWGWKPGAARETVSIPHAEFVQNLKTWVAGGMACPK